MGETWQPEALRNRRLEHLQATMNDYIANNIAQVEGNLPVFYRHVAAALDKTSPGLDDQAYDNFIDAITLTLISTMREAPTTERLEKILRHAMGIRRRRRGRAALDVIVGLKLITVGDYQQAIEYLARYRNYDGRVNMAIAYCYYSLSRTVNRKQGSGPGESELHAREEMLNLSRSGAPLNRLPIFDRKDVRLNRIFWFMLDLAFTWFPGEPGFYRIGILRAKHEGDIERRRHYLTRAIGQFPDDRYFLAEAFDTCLELRDGSGAAGIVKQMMQRYPDDHEPLYFGLKLAILGEQPRSYTSFRKLAIIKEFPGHLLLILDVALEVMSDNKAGSYPCFEEAKRGLPGQNHYITALEYILRDSVEGDEEQSKQAKAAFFASIDQYCMHVLKIGME